jgi:hypothetical protein
MALTGRSYDGFVSRRRVTSVLVAAVAGLTLAGGSGAASSGPVVKNVSGWITALAMDGSQVAYATQAFAPTNCFKLFTWSPVTKGATLVSGSKSGSCGSDTPTGQRIRAVALAGSRIAWIRNLSGNDESDDYLFTATLPRLHTTRLLAATRTGDVTGGQLKGAWINGLVGSGAVLAVNTWTTNVTGAVSKAALSLVGPTALHLIAVGPGTLTAASADTGRIAVARSNATVAIFSSSGRLLRVIAPSSIKQIALRKDYLVVLTKSQTLEIWNSRTGAYIRKWPVPGGATNLDVSQNIAVFSIWRRLYALQLTTGKQALLAQPKRAVVAAEIEAPGVVYAYNTVRGIRTIGNLAFLPLSTVKRAL